MIAQLNDEARVDVRVFEMRERVEAVDRLGSPKTDRATTRVTRRENPVKPIERAFSFA